MWNQHFPRPYVVSGKFTQISIAEVFFSFWGFRKAQLLSYGDLLVVCEVPKLLLDARLRIVGVLQGGANQVGSGSRCWSIWCLYTWILSRPRRHVIEIYGDGTRPDASDTATCDVTGFVRDLHQGHALTQSASDYLCHILKHFQVTCNQCQNCVQPFVGA